MNRVAKIILGMAALLLLTGVGLILTREQFKLEAKFYGRVEDLLPKPVEVPSWKVEYLPIADTPEIKAKVNELLNYDKGVFAVYSRESARFAIYVAYWGPGRMSYRLVAGHTPDVCWVGSGWSIENAQSGVIFSGDRGQQLPPAEERSMSLNGSTEYVLFWHLLDGKPMSYGTNGKPPWQAMFIDLLSRRLNQSPEQFFVRISSNRPFSEWNSSEVYLRFVDRFPGKSSAGR